MINKEVFYQDGYKLATTSLSFPFSKHELFESIKQMYQSIDLLIDSLFTLAERQNIKIACHKGCEWCCHQAVYANSYEIHYLADHIQSNFNTDERNRVIDKSKQKNEQALKLSNEEIQKFKFACPLLKDAACSAYQYRPMACRIYLSTKLVSCLEFYHHPENEKNFPALLDFPLLAGRMMNEGFMAALLEMKIKVKEFRLEEGLSIAMDEKNTSSLSSKLYKEE